MRILLVSTQEGMRDQVGETLRGWARDSRLYWVSQPDLAVARAQEVLPHVILVDDELAGAHAVSLIRELTLQVPGAAILALVGAEAISQAQQAVLAGAGGFVTKPLHGPDLTNALRHALSPRRAPAREPEAAERTPGRIVVFCAPKGGTGRTTLAINTALSLRLATDQPVALVDADYAAPALDVALNLDSHRNVADLLPRLSRLDEDLVSGVLAAHASGVQILLAPPPADLANPISLPHVQHILVLLKSMFPWVIVDLGLPLNETAFGSLDAADRIILSVLPEMVGLRNTRLMLDQLHERGYAQDKVRLVLNRATMRAGVSRSDIEERLGIRIAHHIPDDQPLVTHSINRGVPLMVSHPRSAVARTIRQIAEELLKDLPAEQPAESRRGAGRRWLRRPRATNA